MKGTLIPSTPANETLGEAQRRQGQEEHARLILDALERYSIDLVHMHSLDFHAYTPPGPVPVLATLHLPPDWYPPWVFSLERPNISLNCVSRTEKQLCPASPLIAATVPNGVPVHEFEWRAPRAGYALALGRICPEKGFHLALDAARQAGVEMALAGEVFPYAAHRKYFETEIVPRLDDQRRFIGPANFAAKRALLAHAQCLLVPSTVAETSSLVAMEALASGTPVIAFPSGALPEIVEDHKTGFIVSNVEEMARSIRDARNLRREDCRAAAESRFSSDRMARAYLDLYRQLIEAGPLRKNRWRLKAVSIPNDPSTPAGGR